MTKDRCPTPRRCFIFGALAVKYMPEKPADGDYIIAADLGYDTACSLGIQPDLVVGDFDSLGKAPDFDSVITLNVRKDDTDLEHAVSVALERGFTDFVIYGAVGGKLDHTLGNIAVAERIADCGGRAVFYGDESSLTVIRSGEMRFTAREGGRISVFSMNETARGVTIRGLSYELDNAVLPRAATLGVSNAFVGKDAAISVEDGSLLIVWDSISE